VRAPVLQLAAEEIRQPLHLSGPQAGRLAGRAHDQQHGARAALVVVGIGQGLSQRGDLAARTDRREQLR
jgi:hypothetical protein